MSEKKRYSVLFSEAGVADLSALLQLWLKTSEIGTYVNAKSVNPDGPFFLMTIEEKSPDGTVVEFAIQIPHGYVKAIIYSANNKKIGF